MKTLLVHFCVYLILAANVWQGCVGATLSQEAKSPASDTLLVTSQVEGVMLAVLSNRDQGTSQSVPRNFLSGLPTGITSIAHSTIPAIRGHGAPLLINSDGSDSLLARGCLLTI